MLRKSVGILSLLVALVLRASAFDAPVVPAHSGDPGVALEITRAASYISPGQPVVVRFSAINRSAAPVALVPPDGGDNGLGLPLSFVTGSESQPALTLRFSDEAPVPVRPRAAAAEGTALRLAPGAALGLEVDLRQLGAELRYAGEYLLEWRPAGGAFGSATLTLRILARQQAILTTDFGSLAFSLNYDGAPQNVENFLELVRDRFYNGREFHRLVPGYLLQGGRGPGAGGAMRPDRKRVAGEFAAGVPFEAGTLAMARVPDDPNSASCQFFICLDRRPDLDGQYTIIGWARDEGSLRTLRRLADQPTGGDHRPLKPLMIQSISLQAEESASAEKRDLGAPGAAPQP